MPICPLNKEEGKNLKLLTTTSSRFVKKSVLGILPDQRYNDRKFNKTYCTDS
jgi:hypothetical protein